MHATAQGHLVGIQGLTETLYCQKSEMIASRKVDS